jgi:hypothetical protein
MQLDSDVRGGDGLDSGRRRCPRSDDHAGRHRMETMVALTPGRSRQSPLLQQPSRLLRRFTGMLAAGVLIGLIAPTSPGLRAAEDQARIDSPAEGAVVSGLARSRGVPSDRSRRSLTSTVSTSAWGRTRRRCGRSVVRSTVQSKRAFSLLPTPGWRPRVATSLSYASSIRMAARWRRRFT